MIPGITLPIDWLRMGLRAAPYFLIAVLAVLLVITRAQRDTEKANSKALVAMYEARTAEALASDMDHAADVASAYMKAHDEVSHDLDTQLAAARADAAAHAARLRPPANQGSGSAKALPAVAQAPVGPAGASEAALLDDTESCAANTVKAEVWQAWWTEVSTVTP